MSNQSFNVLSNKQPVRDEKLLLDKIYFLNKSRTKYLVVGISPSVLRPVIKLCSMKSRASIQFSEDEWATFWSNEGIFANYLTYQNVFKNLREKEKCYSAEKINDREVVLKIVDVSCAGEVYIGKESFWDLQHVRYSVNLLLEEFKALNIAKHIEEFMQLSNNESDCVAEQRLIILAQRRQTLPFLVYCAIREYIFIVCSNENVQ